MLRNLVARIPEEELVLGSNDRDVFGHAVRHYVTTNYFRPCIEIAHNMRALGMTDRTDYLTLFGYHMGGKVPPKDQVLWNLQRLIDGKEILPYYPRQNVAHGTMRYIVRDVMLHEKRGTQPVRKQGAGRHERTSAELRGGVD
jgi:hypothetical protein